MCRRDGSLSDILRNQEEIVQKTSGDRVINNAARRRIVVTAAFSLNKIIFPLQFSTTTTVTVGMLLTRKSRVLIRFCTTKKVSSGL